MWPANTSPPLQIFHLAYGIGGILGPFVARPFLSADTGGNSTEPNVTETEDQSRMYASLYPVGLMGTLHYAAVVEDAGTSHIYCAFGIAAAVLAVFGSTNAAVLWAGAALTGIGQGPLFAGLVSWTAGYISMSNKMMSLSIVATAIGSMTAPVIVGQFLDKNPNVFLYVILGAGLLRTTIFVAMYAYLRRGPQTSIDKELLVNEADDEHCEAHS
ncbi:hypothetical protein MTO96_036859 [Rhipicephalus appendiculatus]